MFVNPEHDITSRQNAFRLYRLGRRSSGGMRWTLSAKNLAPYRMRRTFAILCQHSAQVELMRRSGRVVCRPNRDVLILAQDSSGGPQ